MRQYLAIKAGHEDAILFFRMGDFYEMFYEDAKVASEVLGLTLTSRAHVKSSSVPLAGFPYHALDTYLTKMVGSGYRVAVCEQVEDPKQTKTIVKREVTEIITPGTVTSDNLLTSRRNNFLLSVYPQKKKVGVAQVDISTGEFLVDEVDIEELTNIVQDIEPAEILIAEENEEWLKKEIYQRCDPLVTRWPGWQFGYDQAYGGLTRHFQTLTLKGFGCEDLVCGICAAGAALSYLIETQKKGLSHLTKITKRNKRDFVNIDHTTKRNLELIRSINGESVQNTLINVVDKTKTAMGGRKIVQWLLHPLCDIHNITQRQDAVDELLSASEQRENLATLLGQVGDLERLIAKVTMYRTNARELATIRQIQEIIPEVKLLCEVFESTLLTNCAHDIDPLTDLTDLLKKAIVDSPPLAVTDGKIIRQGYSDQLDKIRELASHGKDWIVNLQKSEREKTGITSLKVGYTKVFGYYIEVTKPNLAKVPDSYIRKQTLVNAERYITPELKEFEEQILDAEEKMVALEYQLFEELRQKVAAHTVSLQKKRQSNCNN